VEMRVDDADSEGPCVAILEDADKRNVWEGCQSLMEVGSGFHVRDHVAEGEPLDTL
jgi:hypothetical protein